jgi:hypothetical protein
MVRYEADFAGLGELLRGGEMQSAMREVAGDIMERAEALAPVGHPPQDKHPGMYKAGFSLSVSGHGGPLQDRAEGRVTNDAEDVLLVEDVDQFHTLEHAFRSVADL